ncbi:MAG: tRNA (5-methylaminomethyl-2-thiouridine)(34)-methyltransferase MnmD [Proteiniphilum sp.]|nr:tRNA (5-methylaminomethyl-2-thiouridine)(34)-methyltransferase MnmD [Proteiniphilum sp.]
MRTILETTEDGSHTLYVPELDEHYHSTHGAIQESMHVYIDAGLRHCNNAEINLLEIGFGTGLNAFLTLLEAEKLQKKIHYTTLELYPVSVSNAAMLNFSDIIDPSRKESFEKLHTAVWEEWVQISPFFWLKKLNMDLRDLPVSPPDEKFDLIFYDAFAPEKQPEMWREEIFNGLYTFSSGNAILTTYCAKGVVRRMLQAAGFSVERLSGPPGKREILRARKAGQIPGFPG